MVILNHCSILFKIKFNFFEFIYFLYINMDGKILATVVLWWLYFTWCFRERIDPAEKSTTLSFKQEKKRNIILSASILWENSHNQITLSRLGSRGGLLNAGACRELDPWGSLVIMRPTPSLPTSIIQAKMITNFCPYM